MQRFGGGGGERIRRFLAWITGNAQVSYWLSSTTRRGTSVGIARRIAISPSSELGTNPWTLSYRRFGVVFGVAIIAEPTQTHGRYEGTPGCVYSATKRFPAEYADIL